MVTYKHLQIPANIDLMFQPSVPQTDAFLMNVNTKEKYFNSEQQLNLVNGTPKILFQKPEN